MTYQQRLEARIKDLVLTNLQLTAELDVARGLKVSLEAKCKYLQGLCGGVLTSSRLRLIQKDDLVV